MFKTVEPRFGGSNIIGGANEIRLVALTGSEPAVSAARGRLFRLRAVEAERWDCSCCVRVVRGGGAARRGAPVATQQADDEIQSAASFVGTSAASTGGTVSSEGDCSCGEAGHRGSVLMR